MPAFGFQIGQWSAIPWALGQSVRISYIRMPDWLLPGLLLLYPVYAVFRGPMLQRKRKKSRLCENCGYDLTGNVSGVCPECGTGYEQNRLCRLLALVPGRFYVVLLHTRERSRQGAWRFRDVRSDHLFRVGAIGHGNRHWSSGSFGRRDGAFAECLSKLRL